MSIKPGLCLGLTNRNLLRFNIQSIELDKIPCSNANSSAGFSVSFCVALLSESEIVYFNSNITVKDRLDQDVFITYSNLICKQTLRSYPHSLACFIN